MCGGMGEMSGVVDVGFAQVQGQIVEVYLILTSQQKLNKNA